MPLLMSARPAFLPARICAWLDSHWKIVGVKMVEARRSSCVERFRVEWQPAMHRRLVISAFGLFVSMVGVFLVPADTRADDAALPAESRFVRMHCAECHYETNAEGGFDTAELSGTLDQSSVRRRWIQVHDRVLKGEMPPDAASIDDANRGQFIADLGARLDAADRADVLRNGRGPLRRLTRVEYENNLRDLLHLPDLDVQSLLPEDRVSLQTNKVATTLDLSRVQLDAYLRAADVALRQAIAGGVRPREPRTYRALATKMFPKAVDHAGRESSFYSKNGQMVPLTNRDLAQLRKDDTHDPDMEVAIFRSADWPYYGYPDGFVAHDEGTYRVRFSARAVRQLREFRLAPAPSAQPMTFRARQPSKADVSGDVRAVGGLIDVQPESETYETTVRLKAGETIEYSLLGLPVPFPITSHGGPLYYDFPPMPEGGHAGIAYRWIEIEGPVDPTDWPPASHQRLFGDLPMRIAGDEDSSLPVIVEPRDAREDAARLLRRFALEVSRGSIADESIRPYEALVLEHIDNGLPFAESMLAGYRALLCSSHFLFLREPVGGEDAFAVASRLSHFLWETRPDSTLLDHAAHGKLLRRKVLKQEIDRLIDDDRFGNFIANFTDHWLDLKSLKRDAPDIRLYPEYRGDEYLIESAGREVRSFFATVVRENLPVATLVDCDFAMLNDRLVRHYELPTISGSQMRKVDLPAWSHRGGLLTQAAVMKVTANGTTTSPVIRGAWVMDRILGEPPPPPPEDIPAVEPDLRGATTIRELLAKHASDESCAACHATFDPVGLALENFDILGGWRQRYRSLQKGDEITGIDRAGHKYSYRVARPVESKGRLIDGREFADVRELKSLLSSEPRKIARNLLHRFITDATGTPPRFSDRHEVEKILDRLAPEFPVRELLTEAFLLHALPLRLSEPNNESEQHP